MAEILCKNLCDQGDWWPVHAPGANSDIVSFHHPIAGQTCQTFSGSVDVWWMPRLMPPKTDAGMALCTLRRCLWYCFGVHGVPWRFWMTLLVGKTC